jgi:integrase
LKRTASRFVFTRERVDAATCEVGKQQTIHWDQLQPGLGLRVTASGAKAFIFEGRLGRQTIRMTIGEVSAQIRSKRNTHGEVVVAGVDAVAAQYAADLKRGIDPRAVKRDAIERELASRASEKAEKAKAEVTGLMAWEVYCAARKSSWGERHIADHQGMAAEASKTTQEGLLRPLLARPLIQLDNAAVEAWVKRESPKRKTRVQLGFRLLRGFINWCAEHETYGPLAHPGAFKRKDTLKAVGKPGKKRDALQVEQLAAWFTETEKATPIVQTYLQGLLLVGSRPGEWLSIRWKDVDFGAKTIVIRDKVEGDRMIGLTPYVAHLLHRLPRRKSTDFVFASSDPARAGKTIVAPNDAHINVLKRAGLPHVSLHGLRRSFKSITEWAEVPVGVVAQIMGHKPSATAEAHYTVRPVDLLRKWHAQIEAFILERAGIQFVQPEDARPALRLVNGTSA